MKLKNKILLGSGLLVAIPILVSSLIISIQSSTSAHQALQESAYERLISVRNILKMRVEDYMLTIDKQVKTLAAGQQIIDSMSLFKLAYNKYSAQSNISSETARHQLANYYTRQFSPRFSQRNQGQSAPVSQWLSNLSPTAALLQYQLIQANPHPLGAKEKKTILGDDTEYDRVHQKYHPQIRDYLEKFEYYDIFLVDPDNGNIVYSVFKELDYATSIMTGSFAKSGIGDVFNRANQLANGQSVISDFASYQPSYQDSAAFIATPIFDGQQKIGILIFQMPIGKINNIMTHDKRWSDSGLGISGETYLVGSDKLLRSQSRFLIEDQQTYVKAIRKAGISNNTIQAIQAKRSAIGLQPVTSSSVTAALAGKKGISTIQDYRGIEVLSAYAPLDILGLNWSIIAEIDVSEAFASANAMTRKIQVISVVVGIIMIVLGCIAGLLFANSISRPIIKLSKDISYVEHHSDLTHRFAVNSNDEIGQASLALNNMLIKFHDGIQDVSQNAIKIATAAEETSNITKEGSRLSDNQQRQTDSVAVAMGQLTQTLETVSEHISGAVEAVTEVNQQSTEGYNIMVSTVEAMNALAHRIEDASQIINEFEHHSNDIVAVLDVIKGVAEQTNLLALNAAIEAARAGEQGRGFAVVADEVRALAGRTQKSTAEITEVVDKLKNSSINAIQSMEASSVSAQEVVEQTSLAGERFASVSESVETINQMNTQISDVVQDQRCTAQEIDNNVRSISEMAEESANASQQTVIASVELAESAVSLSNLVNKFKI